VVDGVLVVDVGDVLIILSMDNHCIYRLYRNMSECNDLVNWDFKQKLKTEGILVPPVNHKLGTIRTR